MYFKVVTSDLKSLGLRKNPTIMTFPLNRKIFETRKLVRGKEDYGGIWVANSIGNARTLKKYMYKKYGIICKIFTVEIGEILYQNSYRTKTNWVILRDEVE